MRGRSRVDVAQARALRRWLAEFDQLRAELSALPNIGVTPRLAGVGRLLDIARIQLVSSMHRGECARKPKLMGGGLKCPICGLVFRSKRALQLHNSESASGESRPCPTASQLLRTGWSFNVPGYLMAPRSSHASRPTPGADVAPGRYIPSVTPAPRYSRFSKKHQGGE